MTRFTASGLLLLAALCWGSGNVANKTVLLHLQPLTVVGLRCLLAAVVITPLAMADFRRAELAWVKSAVGVAMLFAVALVLQQLAYVSTSVTNASFLVNTATIMTPILAWAVLNHRPGLSIACAAPLTLLGAFLMAGANLSRLAFNSGDLLCLASAVAYAGWMVALGQHAVAHGRPLGSALVQFAVSAVLVLPLGIAVEAPSISAIRLALPELIMLGVISTALAFGLQTWAQRFVAASTAAILVSAESLFGAAGAYLLLNEQTPTRGLTGAGLILIAIVLVALGDRAPPSRTVPRQLESVPSEPEADQTGRIMRRDMSALLLVHHQRVKSDAVPFAPKATLQPTL
jgi:drug/metabolite transporter (DMT)-like permease